MRTFIVGLLTIVGAVGTVCVGTAGATDDASLISEDIFDPSITVSEARRPPGSRSPGLVINPTFDTSITNDPNATTIMNTINAAIAVYEAQFTDSVTVAIKFREMNSGLGLSSTAVPCLTPCSPSCTCGSISYASYRTALAANQSGANDVSALATLPGGAYNPVDGNTNVWAKTANLRALGFVANPSLGQPDSTISLNTSICNLDRVTINPSKYDLMAVVSHEIDEALGLGSILPGGSLTGPVFPQDLFRYDQNFNRSFNASSSSQAFFSIDGASQLVQYNQGPGGDFGDWFSTGPHTPRVQDAIGTQGATPDLGVELIALDVIGYTLSSPPPTATATQVGFCGGTNATCTPTPTPDDYGLVPPIKDVAKCEAGVAKNLSKFKSCIEKCHIKAVAAQFNMEMFNEEACENDPVKSCRVKYNATQAKLLAKGTCPACLDTTHQTTLADQAEADLDANNGGAYCEGSVALGGDETGFVPLTADALKCEAGVAKNVKKLRSCIGKCHIKAAAAAFKVKLFDEEACEETLPGKSCRAKYDAKQASLLAAGNCPPCLGAAQQMVLGDQVETGLDNDNGGIYCAGTRPLPSQAPVPTRTPTNTSTPTATPTPVWARALAIDPSTTSTLYAGTNSNGVFKSTNGAGNWSAANTGLTNPGIEAVAIDPSTPSTLYAAGGGAFKSTDSGGNWNAANTGLSGGPVFALAIDPSTPSTLYAGNEDGANKSTNSGGSWSLANTGLGGNFVFALAIDPSTPSTLYAGTGSSGVYKSTNSGASWTAANTGLSGAASLVNALVIDPSTPSTLYAGGNNGGGVYKSTDSGGTWSAVNNGLSGPALSIGSGGGEGLAIDPSTPSTLYAGTNDGVYKSTNSGGSWTAANTGMSGNALEVTVVQIDPSTPSTLYAGTDAGVYKSTNSGGSWSPANSGLIP